MTIQDLTKPVDRSQYEDPDMPNYPGYSLVSHVVFSGAMVGGTVGTIAAMGVSGFRMFVPQTLAPGVAVPPTVYHRSLLFGRYGILAGAVLSAGMVLHKAATDESMNPEGIADRAYRLQFNNIVKHMSIYSGTGGVVGGVAAAAVPSGTSLGISSRLVGGMGVGAAFGLVGAVYAIQAAKAKEENNN